jgi:PAS domain S-box-containing protein
VTPDRAEAADLLDRLPAGILTVDDDGRILRINATLLEMLGRPRDETLGRHVETILTLGSRLFYQTHLFPMVRMVGRADEIFLLIKTQAGEDVGVIANLARREEADRTLYDFVLLRVQERRRFEEELLRAKRAAESAQAQIEEQATELEVMTEELLSANEELRLQTEAANRMRESAEAANRAKSDFLTWMSHELRTPLNAVGGYAELLTMGVPGPVNERQLDMLRRISRNQAHLLGLVNQLLDLSKIEAGGVSYAIEEIDVTGVVDSVVPMIEPQLTAKRLAFTASAPPGLRVRADRDKVRQILVNLLGNAIKFTAEGGHIRLEGAPKEGAAERLHQVALSVHDTGIGIAPEMQAAVFEPFVQVEGRQGRSRPLGTGLGLAISRELARGMGGDITLVSAPGSGSTFTLVLPSPGTANETSGTTPSSR